MAAPILNLEEKISFKLTLFSGLEEIDMKGQKTKRRIVIKNINLNLISKSRFIK